MDATSELVEEKVVWDWEAGDGPELSPECVELKEGAIRNEMLAGGGGWEKREESGERGGKVEKEAQSERGGVDLTIYSGTTNDWNEWLFQGS